MGRGLGAYQRKLIDALQQESPEGSHAWAVSELAEHCGGSPRQTLAACRALEARELVRIWRGTVRWIEAEDGFASLERPVPGLLIADRKRADRERARVAALLAGI